MKNSASNSSITQALREQATQLLPVLFTTLTQLGYFELSHQRISQQNHSQNDHFSTSCYQGLTRALHKQFGQVMIKWQLSLSSENSYDLSDLSDLNYELAVLKALNTLRQTQTNTLPIAPPVLAYNTLNVQLLEQSYQLTILVMPYYPLGSLVQQHSNKGPQPLSNKQKQQLIVQAAYLINNLHRQGWLHNDIKPSNILLDSFLPNRAHIDNTTPSLLLTDFALASRFEIDFRHDRITNPAGTLAYLAPERWQGQSATQQSDVYAFGILLYEVLTGERPFKISSQSSEPLKDWAIQHCQTPIPLLSEKYYHYQPIINKALAKRIEKRYQSMEEVLEGLKLLENR